MTKVWTFTNKKELSKSEFLDYIERKVFRTVRKHKMLPVERVFSLKKDDSLNGAVLKKILEIKFKVEYSNKPTLSSDNLSEIAENVFREVLKGNFKYELPTNSPLIFLSDREIELYAKLKKISGKKRKKDVKIQKLFKRFLKRNQDLELNIIKAQTQII